MTAIVVVDADTSAATARTPGIAEASDETAAIATVAADAAPADLTAVVDPVSGAIPHYVIAVASYCERSSSHPLSDI